MAEQEIFDDYIWSDNKKIITADHHGISGLGNFSQFSFSGDNTCPLHYHSHIFEIHCLVKGQRTVQILEDGLMTEYTATGNELLITFPFELHEIREKNRYEFFAFQLDVRQGIPFLGLNEEFGNALRCELLGLEHRHLRVGNSHLALLRTAFNLFAYGSSKDRYSAISHLTSFLFSLKYLEPILAAHQKPANSNIQQAASYIMENIEKPITLQDLADISGYSLSHFKFKFKEYFGITPAEYISLQKIRAAEKELSSSNITITDLAYKLGFSSSNYFCTVFKRVLGYSPSDYRKKIRNH